MFFLNFHTLFAFYKIFTENFSRSKTIKFRSILLRQKLSEQKISLILWNFKAFSREKLTFLFLVPKKLQNYTKCIITDNFNNGIMELITCTCCNIQKMFLNRPILSTCLYENSKSVSVWKSVAGFIHPHNLNFNFIMNTFANNLSMQFLQAKI